MAKYENIIFIQSKKGTREAHISDELFAQGYYFYKDLKYFKGRQWWVLMKGNINELHMSSNLRNLDYWITKNLIKRKANK